MFLVLVHNWDWNLDRVFTKGFGRNALDFASKMGVQKRKSAEKDKSRIRPEVKSFLSLYDKNKAFDSEMIGGLEELSHKYLDQG